MMIWYLWFVILFPFLFPSSFFPIHTDIPYLTIQASKSATPPAKFTSHKNLSAVHFFRFSLRLALRRAFSSLFLFSLSSFPTPFSPPSLCTIVSPSFWSSCLFCLHSFFFSPSRVCLLLFLAFAFLCLACCLSKESFFARPLELEFRLEVASSTPASDRNVHPQ